MEIILNELSLHNQFLSFDDFRSTSLIEMIRFFSLGNSVNILKKSDIFLRQVYDSRSLHDLLITKDINGRSEEIKKIKIQLTQIIGSHYWDFDKQCENDNSYTHKSEDVCHTALAESYERNVPLISFIPSNFSDSSVQVEKDKSVASLRNFTNFKELVVYLYEHKLISFEEYCKKSFKDTKLDFSKVNSPNSFGLISDRNDEIEFNNSFNMFAEMSWGDILKQGGTGANKVGLAFARYHNQSYFSGYSVDGDIYKFRASQKYRVFGYRNEDVFYVLEFDLTHRLSD